MIETYAEYGAIGIIVVLFVGMIHFLKSTLFSKLKEIEDINIKLIDRWNRSDEARDRRHEDLIKATLCLIKIGSTIPRSTAYVLFSKES